MRGLIDGIGSPTPIIGTLPAVYQDDPFTARFTSAFDSVLAPVILALDNLEAYVDPALAPRDFVDWLAGWVGFPIGESWPDNRSRELIGTAVELYRWQGTVRGLRTLLRVYTGVEPEVIDSGRVTWSAQPATTQSPAGTGRRRRSRRRTEVSGEEPEPGKAPVPVPHVTVRVRGARAAGVDERQIEALIQAAKPAHVGHTLEVVD